MKLKFMLRDLVLVFAGFNTAFHLFERTLGWIVDYVRISRRMITDRRHVEGNARLMFLSRNIPDLQVYSGPFRGMRYPRLEASGSALVPKLTGSYENELNETFEQVVSTGYRIVIDIGCAEGYYAVGLARRMPETLVLAFDIDKHARDLCRQMAEENGVADRVLVGNRCDTERLVMLTQGHRAFIVCDVEGYEDQLFSEQSAKALAAHDILIETHDCFIPGIAERLRQRFSASHDITSIWSRSDAQKAETFDCDLFSKVSDAERIDLVTEGRPEAMQWLVLLSRRSH